MPKTPWPSTAAARYQLQTGARGQRVRIGSRPSSSLARPVVGGPVLARRCGPAGLAPRIASAPLGWQSCSGCAYSGCSEIARGERPAALLAANRHACRDCHRARFGRRFAAVGVPAVSSSRRTRHSTRADVGHRSTSECAEGGAERVDVVAQPSRSDCATGDVAAQRRTIRHCGVRAVATEHAQSASEPLMQSSVAASK